MKILKTVLLALFCPILIFFDHNPNEAIVHEKTGAVKYLLALLFVGIVFVLVYYVWGELL